jgi:hypothetical protein
MPVVKENREDKKDNNEGNKMMTIKKTITTLATLATLYSTPALAGKTELQATSSGVVTDTILGAKKEGAIPTSFALRNRWQIGYDGNMAGVVLTQIGVGDLYGFTALAETRVLASKGGDDSTLALVPYTGIRYTNGVGDNAKITTLLRVPIQKDPVAELFVVPYWSVDLANEHALTVNAEQFMWAGKGVLNGRTRASATYELVKDFDVGATGEVNYGLNQEVTGTVGGLARVNF